MMQFYSQRDPKWKDYRLGFGEPGVTIGQYGCLVTSAAMVLTTLGFPYTPYELNLKLQKINGFTGGLMYTSMLNGVVPSINVRLITCQNNPAPMTLINATLDKGIPVIVEVDGSSASGYQNHWVVIYKRDGSRYLMADPWPYPCDKGEVTIQQRYGFAGDLATMINNVLILEPTGDFTPVGQASAQTESSQDQSTSAEPEAQPVQNAPSTSTGKIRVVTDSLRLRVEPNTTANIISKLSNGVELQSAGDPVVDGAVVWQPVLLYVAAEFGGQKYVERL